LQTLNQDNLNKNFWETFRGILEADDIRLPYFNEWNGIEIRDIDEIMKLNENLELETIIMILNGVVEKNFDP
jgi:succinate dehydrogenase flavin-adding protein (antitoxin of CptAB toxin-antitoxin module)